MVDKNTIFGGMLTTLGANKKTNCDALGIPWEPKYMLIGDANGTDPVPSPSQTRLINQVYRAQLNQLRVSEKDANVLIAELVLPPDVGGWWIRELALEDKDGVFCAVSNVAPSYKPLLEQNSGRNQVVRMHIITNGTSNIQLKIDPSVVLATREYVDTKILEELYKLDNKQSVRAATTANIELAGLQTIDGVSLLAGDRVLVKNQAVSKENGIYIAGIAAWQRAADADSGTEVTSALILSVEQGATLADTRWQLITDGTITLGTTPLTFQNVTQGFAAINAPALINPTANTPTQFDNSRLLATTEFVQRALGNYKIYGNLPAGVVTAAHMGGLYQPAEGAAILLPVPAVAGIPSGGAITIVMGGRTSCTVAAVPGASLTVGLANNTVKMVEGQSITFVAITETLWIGLVSGGLGLTAEFGALFGMNGYQKLPSGLVLQWGWTAPTTSAVTATFPIAFPNRCAWIGSQDNGGAPNVSIWTFTLNGQTGFTGHNIGALNKGSASFLAAVVSSCAWLAVGY